MTEQWTEASPGAPVRRDAAEGVPMREPCAGDVGLPGAAPARPTRRQCSTTTFYELRAGTEVISTGRLTSAGQLGRDDRIAFACAPAGASDSFISRARRDWSLRWRSNAAGVFGRPQCFMCASW
jgi:hypothetical protein